MKSIKTFLTAMTLTSLAACSALPGGGRGTGSTGALVIQEQGSFAVGGKVVTTPGTYSNNNPTAAGQSLHHIEAGLGQASAEDGVKSLDAGRYQRQAFVAFFGWIVTGCHAVN